MNAQAFREYFDYHFAENRKIWDSYIVALPQEQFVQNIDYSIGSVRNHIIHLMNVDEAWFSGLREVQEPEFLDATTTDNRDIIRAHGDRVENTMRDYLANLQDDMLFTNPLADEEDRDLVLWQVLLHVINHGTDHRAQVLRLLNDLGVETAPQDYVFYIYDRLGK